MSWYNQLFEGIDLFISSLGQSWLQRALMASILIGIMSAIIGVFVILRGFVFLGESIAHSAFAGAALALLLGIDPLLVILVFGVATALSIGAVNEKKIMKDEVVIGVFFSFSMALAIFFIGLLPSYSASVESILFGRVLLITRENFVLLLIFTTLVVSVVFLVKKELYIITFDSELAKAMGIPVRFMDYLFLVLVALAIDVSLNAIGALLVFAFLVTPAAAAYQWTYSVDRMILLSIVFGIFSSFFGLLLSFIYDLPSGATMVMLVTFIFAVSFVFSPKRKAGTIECPVCKDSMDIQPHMLGECQEISTEPHIHADDKILLVEKSKSEEQ